MDSSDLVSLPTEHHLLAGKITIVLLNIWWDRVRQVTKSYHGRQRYSKLEVLKQSFFAWILWRFLPWTKDGIRRLPRSRYTFLFQVWNSLCKAFMTNIVLREEGEHYFKTGKMRQTSPLWDGNDTMVRASHLVYVWFEGQVDRAWGTISSFNTLSRYYHWVKSLYFYYLLLWWVFLLIQIIRLHWNNWLSLGIGDDIKITLTSFVLSFL